MTGWFGSPSSRAILSSTLFGAPIQLHDRVSLTRSEYNMLSVLVRYRQLTRAD